MVKHEASGHNCGIKSIKTWKQKPSSYWRVDRSLTSTISVRMLNS